MIYLDDAGTGCCIGTAILVAYRLETKEKAVGLLSPGASVVDVGLKILNDLAPQKDETIAVCRGDKLKGLISKLAREGFHVVSEKITGEAQDVTENEFLEQLYGLGLSREVTLHGDDYLKLHNDILDDMFLHPELLNHVRPHYCRNTSINEVYRKIDRLVNEFPNLYAILKES